MANPNLIGGSGIEGASGSTPKDGGKKGLLRTFGESINRHKHALMIAGGLAVGASTLPIAPGCAYETGGKTEKTGTSRSALSTSWNTGNLGVDNASPDTHWDEIDPNVGYRLFVSDNVVYISTTNNAGTSWSVPTEVQTASGPLLNDPSSIEYGPRACKFGGCGAGKIIVPTDRGGKGVDLWWWDWDETTKMASNGVKMPNVNVDWDGEFTPDINSTGTWMIFDRDVGGSNPDVFQYDMINHTAPQKVTGLSDPNVFEQDPFFLDDNTIAVFRDQPLPYGHIYKAENFNPSTHSVGTISVIPEFDVSAYYESRGDTDSKGGSCITVMVTPGQNNIYCDPDFPGLTVPDGGTGGTGGSGGSGIDAGGAGGSAGTGGSGVDSGTGGAGGIDAGGTGGSSPDAGTGGAGGAGGTGGTETGGTGGSAGAGGTETGGAAGSGPDAGGAGGTGGIDAGGAGGSGVDAGGAGGSGMDAGGTDGTETGGSAGSGVDAGEEEGSAPDCRIKVTTNSGDCEVVDCGNYAVGGVVTLHMVNGDCYYIDPLQNVLHITGTGDSYIQQYNLALAQTVGVEVTHPSGNPKITFGYQTDNGSNMNAGTLGTIVDSKVENRNGEKGVYFHVSKDAVDTTICNSNKECTGVSTFDYGAGPGIVTEGKNIWMSFKDIDQIADSIVQQPDAGQIITPPAENKDGGGCSLCSASPKDISHDINGWIGLVLVGGAMAYRRSRRA